MSVAIKIFSVVIFLLLLSSCEKRSAEDVLEMRLHENSPLKGNLKFVKRSPGGKLFIFEADPSILDSLKLSKPYEASTQKWTYNLLSKSHLKSKLSEYENFDYYHGEHEIAMWIRAMTDNEQSFFIIELL